MSYRKTEVDGKVYEWTSGKKFVKIKDVGLIPIEKIGTPTRSEKTFVVSPKNIANYIRGKGLPTFKCRHGTVTTKLISDPFDAEIYGKYTLMLDCPTCEQISADEI